LKQFELLELQSKIAEQFSQILESQKKDKVEGCDFDKFRKMSLPSFEGGPDPTMAKADG